jgi:hypothetical protein
MDRTSRTIGVSPKLVASVVTVVVTYLLTQTVLALPPAAVVACQALLVAVSAFVASPGVTTASRPDAEEVEAIEAAERAMASRPAPPLVVDGWGSTYFDWSSVERAPARVSPTPRASEQAREDREGE